MVFFIVLLLVLLVVAVYLVMTYNGLVALRNRIENSWAQIDVKL